MDARQEGRMVIVVTGGAGSLGKAFVRMLSPHHTVICVDNNEWAVAEFRKEFPNVECLLMDFDKYDFFHKPEVLIHCAAYKHLPLGEENPEAFIDNNIVRTNKLFKACNQHRTKFLFISTDKAVRPISLYGMTKSIGEKLALYYGGRVARLGNIIGSSGSVIPVWEKCIREQRPIPITDERMVRYFIDEMEAVSVVWDRFMDGDLIIIPEMEKVRLLDLLREVLNKHGYDINPTDNWQVYTPGVEVVGMNPAEKLEEELEW